MKKENSDKYSHVKKVLLWVALGSITMFFAGLTSAYLVRKAEGNWLVFNMPIVFYCSTVLLFLSNITFVIASKATKQEKSKKQMIFLITTLALALGFVLCQISGWQNLVSQNVFFTGEKSNAAGSFFYVLTLSHLIHLLGGVISLIVVIFVAAKKKYTPNNMTGLELSLIYWHYLDILWIYLFLFLLFVK